ncbi:hypothetical protein NC651_003246 [Populus alba x Populus x berolinensis]|nr:hypothetical protein NC651_003246 [Populus alba x Populus x berolinensis]
MPCRRRGKPVFLSEASPLTLWPGLVVTCNPLDHINANKYSAIIVLTIIRKPPVTFMFILNKGQL